MTNRTNSSFPGHPHEVFAGCETDEYVSVDDHGDMVFVGASARIPRPVRARFLHLSALRAVEGEIRIMSQLCGTGYTGASLDFAYVCNKFGRGWGHGQHRPGPIPSHMNAPGGWPESGCDERTDEFIRRNPDEHLIPYTGWILWVDDEGKRMIWEHTWCVDRNGVLLDPSTAICGVPKGWAYIGLPEWVWYKVEAGEPLDLPFLTTLLMLRDASR